MFNVSFKLRKNLTCSSLKGPSFTSAKHLKFEIDRTVVSIKLPEHNSSLASRSAILPNNEYFTEQMTFRTYSKDLVLNDNWRNFDLAYRSWKFNGDWFTGVLSELSVYIELIKKNESDKDISLFHPRAFEQAVADYLTHQYSKRKINGTPGWIAPVNWKTIDIHSINAAYFEIKPNINANAEKEKIRVLMFPINSFCILRVSFNLTRFLNKPEEELDKLVDPKPMNDLMWDIINSIQINLSKDATKQQIKALEGLENPLLIESFPPLKWDATDMDKLEKTHK